MSWSYALRQRAQSLTQETSRTVNMVFGYEEFQQQCNNARV